MLFNEPKLLKYVSSSVWLPCNPTVSVLFNEPKLLKYAMPLEMCLFVRVSVLFNEPKLLK